MITVTGQATFEDYLCAQRSHSRKRDLIIVCILLCISAFVALTAKNYIFPAIVVVYVFGIRPFYIRSRLKRNWEQTPSAHTAQKTYRLDEVGFHTDDDAGNPMVNHWDKFHRFRESKHTFFLYLSPNMYLFLPKRFMSAEDRESTRKLLKERIEHPAGHVR